MADPVKEPRRSPGVTRLSSKHQVTIPVEALRKAGLRVGERLRVSVRGPGILALVREDDPLEAAAGALTGLYPRTYLKALRREWR